MAPHRLHAAGRLDEDGLQGLIADLFEQAHDIIQSVDIEGRYLYVNRRWHDLLGYGEEDLPSLNLFDVIHPDHVEHCRAQMAQLVQAGHLDRVRTVFVGKDGQERIVEGTTTLRVEDGRPVSTRGIFRDITEQHRAQRRAEELLQQFRAVVEHAPVGIALYAAGGPCVEANQALGDQVGASREQLLRQDFRELGSWRRYGLAERAELALRTGARQQVETWMETTFGRSVCVRCRFVPVALEGAPHLLLFTEDVTADRYREQAMLSHQERQRRVHRIAEDIARVRPLPELLQELSESARSLVSAEVAALVTLDPDRGAPDAIHPSNYPLDRVPEGTEVRGQGVLGVVARGAAIHSADIRSEPAFEAWPEWHPPLGPMIGLPIHGDEQQVRAILLVGRPPGAPPFSAEDRALLETVASLAAVAMRSAAQFELMQQLNERLAQQAVTDALTGLGNRRAFADVAARFHSEAVRYRRSYGALMVDVDRFKAYNDRYGHPAGDRVLADLARALAGAIRLEDRVFRYGGEEIVLLLPEQREEGLRALAERLRERVRQEAIEHADGVDGVVTVSVGGAVFDPGQDAGEEGWEAVVERADRALYRAKQAGRDRVEIGRRTA